VKVPDVSLRAVPSARLTGSGVSTPPAARNKASVTNTGPAEGAGGVSAGLCAPSGVEDKRVGGARKSAAPPEGAMGARPNLSLVPDDNLVDLDEWRPHITPVVAEFICAHTKLLLLVRDEDREAFNKFLIDYNDKHIAFNNHLVSRGGAA